MISRSRKVAVRVDTGEPDRSTTIRGITESAYHGKLDEPVELKTTQGSLVIPARRILWVEEDR